MAIRSIREEGDPVLSKRAKEVAEITPRIREMAADMLETMYDAGGVGLAAPQIGVLKRMVVIDCSEEQDQPLILINPVIVESSGEQTGYEGCLSVPGKTGVVTRPSYVRVKALDLEGKPLELEGTELLARAFCHELDHLEGHMYTELVRGELIDNELLARQNEEQDPEQSQE